MAAPAGAGHHGATRAAMDAGGEGRGAGRDGDGAGHRRHVVGHDGRGRREDALAPRGAADRYRVGSITKTFVSTVLLQLEAERRLSLDDEVEKWLRLVRGHGHDGRRITVRQLLHHTSGIFNYTTDDDFARTYFLKDGFLEHRYDTKTPEQLVAIAMAHAPLLAPGTSWSYSNTNYVLAGMVVEKVTGHSSAAIRRRVIEPLGLRATSVPGTRTTLPRPSSHAYSGTLPGDDGPDVRRHAAQPLPGLLRGEMISDSADLNRFYAALMGGRLLPPKQLKEMRTTVKADEIPGARYGLGLIDRKLSCGVRVGPRRRHPRLDVLRRDDGGRPRFPGLQLQRGLSRGQQRGDRGGVLRRVRPWTALLAPVRARGSPRARAHEEGPPDGRRPLLSPPGTARSVAGAGPRHTPPDPGRSPPSTRCGPPAACSIATRSFRGVTWTTVMPSRSRCSRLRAYSDQRASSSCPWPCRCPGRGARVSSSRATACSGQYASRPPRWGPPSRRRSTSQTGSGRPYSRTIR